MKKDGRLFAAMFLCALALLVVDAWMVYYVWIWVLTPVFGVHIIPFGYALLISIAMTAIKTTISNERIKVTSAGELIEKCFSYTASIAVMLGLLWLVHIII